MILRVAGQGAPVSVIVLFSVWGRINLGLVPDRDNWNGKLWAELTDIGDHSEALLQLVSKCSGTGHHCATGYHWTASSSLRQEGECRLILHWHQFWLRLSTRPVSDPALPQAPTNSTYGVNYLTSNTGASRQPLNKTQYSFRGRNHQVRAPCCDRVPTIRKGHPILVQTTRL